MKELDAFVGLRLPPGVKTEIEKQAKNRDLSLSAYLRRLIVAVIDDQPDSLFDQDKQLTEEIKGERVSIQCSPWLRDWLTAEFKKYYFKGFSDGMAYGKMRTAMQEETSYQKTSTEE